MFRTPEEGRSTHRYPVRQAALIEMGGKRVPAMLLDVTHGGLGLSCSAPPPPAGTRVVIGVLMEGAAMELPAAVVWFWNEADLWRVGLHVDSEGADPASVGAFRRWLSRLESSGATRPALRR